MSTNRFIGGLNILTLFLSIYILSVLLIDMIYSFDPQTKRVINYIDTFICLVFFIEFWVRLYKSENKLTYLKWGWIDLVASIPTIDIFRSLRIVRIIRVVRLIRIIKASSIIYKYLFESRKEGVVTSVLTFALLIVMTSSIMIIQVESASQESNIHTAEEAIWWVIVTITTVGYGDFYPVTSGGRLLSVFLMMAGIGLFSTFTAMIANFLIADRKISS